ncbi:MAG: hypothetical protein GY886_03200 [Gammaproteobacteria bacterium]|nr:hypothetical protein [Gammaproteobacteria bacterium]MCP4928099.1 hypothetical protein [Gammaproteobacteria bacterium]
MNQAIAIMLFTVAGFLSAGVQAAPVTIDFEAGTVDYFNYGWGPIGSTVGSQGFEITGGSFSVGDGPEGADLYTGNNGTVVYGAEACCSAQDFHSPRAYFNLERADGGAFALYSVDFYGEYPDPGLTRIIGDVVGGGSVSSSSTALGTGGWLNLESVDFYSGGINNAWGFALGELDNIVVSAVPVPAAVWLFGSALAGLGWMRLKQTA